MGRDQSTSMNSRSGHMTAHHVQAFRTAIEQITGLHFDDWRMDTLQRTLSARMDILGLGNVDAYLNLLQSTTARSGELNALLNELTIRETFFFRYPAQFDFLRESVLPSLVERNASAQAPVRIWSAGCSTGEEPYSIAIVALELFGSAAKHLVDIVATDVSSEALRAARRAEYQPRPLRLLGSSMLAKYFHRVSDQRFVVNDDVRQMVRFMESNLATDTLSSIAAWDIIFCRNVLIYFTQESAAGILDRLDRALRPTGLLFVGHSEMVSREGLFPCEPEGLFAFQKEGDSARRLPSTPTVQRSAHNPVSSARQQVKAPSSSSAEEAATLQSPPAEEKERLFKEAVRAFDREDYATACQQLDRLLHQSPCHLAGVLLRANTFLNLGEHQHSVNECEVALQLDPLACEAHLLLGMNFLRQGKNELALAALRKAAYLAPESCTVQYHLGEASRACGMREQAARAYAAALALLPSAAERDIRTYCGGFGKTTLQRLCEQMIACPAEPGVVSRRIL